MNVSIPKQHEQQLSRNEEKWTQTLMAAGWTALPSVIIERQQAIGLDPLDINIILILANHWWYAERLPYPTKKSIAETMGVSPATVQRRIAALEHSGLIKRIPKFHAQHGQIGNEYDLTGLIEAVKPYAEEKVRVMEERKAEDAARRKRKRPLTRAGKAPHLEVLEGQA